MPDRFAHLTAQEAAQFIQNKQCVAFGGFTPAGCPKAIPCALAQRAEELHGRGKVFKIQVITGASTNEAIDGDLSRVQAIERRTPYQTNADLRIKINTGAIAYMDLHISQLDNFIRNELWGPLDWAIIEVADYTAEGECLLTSAVGAAPSFCEKAKHILLEYNTYHPSFIRGLHDLYQESLWPHRKPIQLENVRDRLGTNLLKIDPKKIVGIVETHEANHGRDFKISNEIYRKIGEHVAEFLLHEMRCGRIPKNFLPVQSGVGNIANAVLKVMGQEMHIPTFTMYSEVVQNAVIDLIQAGRISFASATALTLTDDYQQTIYKNWDFFKNKLILRPENITNHPEIIQRLGIISLNAALEVDCFGHVNSTHVAGNSLMNGIGGSNDFTRHASISIFTLPSSSKNETISGIVPFCSHVDHTEHDVQVIITEQGIADLRGKSPVERAILLIEQCAHPVYKPLLRHYLKLHPEGHIGHDLSHAFDFHKTFLNEGDMRLCKF